MCGFRVNEQGAFGLWESLNGRTDRVPLWGASTHSSAAVHSVSLENNPSGLLARAPWRAPSWHRHGVKGRGGEWEQPIGAVVRQTACHSSLTQPSRPPHPLSEAPSSPGFCSAGWLGPPGLILACGLLHCISSIMTFLSTLHLLEMH